jgi:hypothetical protein
MLRLHSERFVGQVERALNDHYNFVNSSEHNTDGIISIPEVRATLEEDEGSEQAQIQI